MLGTDFLTFTAGNTCRSLLAEHGNPLIISLLFFFKAASCLIVVVDNEVIGYSHTLWTGETV